MSNAKRRRLVDTWSKQYDDNMINSSSSSDPMEDLGRQHWIHSNTLPIQIRPLTTTCQSGKWCYFPKPCNNITWEDMKHHGVPGVHYAVGYKQLGEMIIKYGSDYSTWPTLTSLHVLQNQYCKGSY